MFVYRKENNCSKGNLESNPQLFHVIVSDSIEWIGVVFIMFMWGAEERKIHSNGIDCACW